MKNVLLVSLVVKMYAVVASGTAFWLISGANRKNHVQEVL